MTPPVNMIRVAFATDDKYLDYALTAVASMLANNHGDSFEIYLLHFNLAERDLKRFDALKELGNFQLLPLRVDPAIFEGFPTLHWGLSMYLRLLLPKLLPHVEKIIYLDCDLLVLDDIAELWNFDLQESHCAAVSVKVAPEHLHKIGLPCHGAYFNSGVMIFRPQAMASANMPERFQKLMTQYANVVKYPDQDLLNIIYHDSYELLPLRWNIITSLYRNPPSPGGYSTLEIIEALRHPGIVHFTGTHKPWLFFKSMRHPYGVFFAAYAKMAKWNKKRLLLLYLKSLIHSRVVPPRKNVPWDHSILLSNSKKLN